jgi:thymidine phosphorylase
MLAKVKSLNIIAGRPVAFLPIEIAKWLNVAVGDRIAIKKYGQANEIAAIVDITKTEERDCVYLSNEVFSILKLAEGDVVEINPAQKPLSIFHIKEKLDGKKLSYEKIYEIISKIVKNELSEAEIAYFVSACYTRGMSMDEIFNLTKAMIEVGKRISFDTKYVLDKHCIGGIPGNRVTPLITSIVAAAIKEFKLDAVMPKTSSRAITSAAGTADVIELIARVEFDVDEIKAIVKKAYGCLVWGGGLGISPADDKIIHVERFLNLDPENQLIASIMSKKIAVGSNTILIDIPYGKGAKAESLEKARKLKTMFETIAKRFKVKLKAVLTDGKQPIGNGIGPMLELIDSIAVLKNKPNKPLDLYNKSVFLAKQLLAMVNKKAAQSVEHLLKSGKAYEAFERIIKAQGGEVNEKKLMTSGIYEEIKSEKDGKIVEIDNKKINFVARVAGCPVDKLAGIYLMKHLGDKVEKAEPYAILYAETKEKLQHALKVFKSIAPITIK